MSTRSDSPALTRRQALGRLSGAAAAAVTACAALSPVSALAAAPRWKTAIGLNGFESGIRKYHKNYPIWEILDFASRSGFDGVELVDGWPFGTYPAAAEKDRLRSLRRQYDAFGLSIFSIQLGAGDASAPEAEARKNWLATFKDRATAAKALGCSCVGLWPGGPLRGLTVDQGIEVLARTFHEVGKIAADLGLIAAFEIEPPFAFNKAEHLIRIHGLADHSNLKVIYDPSHFDLMNGSTGRPHELMQKLGVGNIGYLQFTDTDGTLRDGGTSKHLGCGDGHVDIPESLRILREGGWDGWMMIDAWEVPDPYDASLKGKRAIDTARTISKKPQKRPSKPTA